MMLHHTLLLTIAICLLVAGLVGAAFYAATRPATLKFAVGPANGEDAKLVQAVHRHFSSDRANIQLRLVNTAGAAESAKAIDDKKADLAVVRQDIAMPKSGLAVAILRKNVVVLLVPAPGSAALGAVKPPEAKPAKGAKGVKPKKTAKPKGIEKVEDIKGRRVGVIGRTSANVDVLNAILKQYEVLPDHITIVALDPDNVAASLRDNPVDVIFGAGPVTARYFADAIAASSADKESPTFLKLGAAQAIENRLPVYEATEIKAGVFGGHKPLPEEDVETIGFSHYIMARRDLSEAEVADFTKLLFGVRQALGTEFPGAAKIEKPDTDRDATVAAHPGAAAYLDNDQKTFFDRYSDLLYWGLMVSSFLGSGIAWLTSYTKADERLRHTHVLDQLIELMTAARKAETIEELDKLRADVDDILRKTIQQAEQHALDEQALAAFRLALDQAQLAISDRRVMLTGQTPRQATAATMPDVTPLRFVAP
jgi:TRAP-type uncharacterized transport system substrate-binding protein